MLTNRGGVASCPIFDVDGSLSRVSSWTENDMFYHAKEGNINLFLFYWVVLCVSVWLLAYPKGFLGVSLENITWPSLLDLFTG
jgi:hypothetical protein